MPLTGHHNQELFDVIGTLLVTSTMTGATLSDLARPPRT